MSTNIPSKHDPYFTEFLAALTEQKIRPLPGFKYNPSRFEGILMMVPVLPDTPYPSGLSYYNCLKHQLQFGGAIVHGWALWHVGIGHYIAEHHALWDSPAGSLVDVSPQPVKKLMFLADGNTSFDFREGNGAYNFEYHASCGTKWKSADGADEATSFRTGLRKYSQNELEIIKPLIKEAIERGVI